MEKGNNCEAVNGTIKSISIQGQKLGFVPTKTELKTIYDVKRTPGEMIRKIIDLEVQNFQRVNPDYIYTNIRVKSKGNDTVTYEMIYVHKSYRLNNAGINR
jgi:hypothetical protein